MDMMLWNIVLTGALGLVGFVGGTMHAEIKRLSILINRTREEVAKEYVTKVEVHADMTRVMDRLDSLDAKIDRLIESKRDL